MGRGADAGRTVVDRSRPGLGGGDQVLDGFPALGGRHDQDVGVLADHQGAGQVPGQVERKVRHNPGRDGVRRGVRQDGVAVGFGADHRAHAESSTGAAAVLDNDRLTELHAERLEQRTRHDIGGAAGGEWNEGPDRFGRPRLRECRAGTKSDCRGHDQRADQNKRHDWFRPLFRRRVGRTWRDWRGRLRHGVPRCFRCAVPIAGLRQAGTDLGNPAEIE